MKTLKLKSVLFSLLTVALFLTSCQQDALTDNLISVEEKTVDTELRSPDVNTVIFYIDYVVLKVRKRSEGQSSNVPDYYDALAGYLADNLPGVSFSDIRWSASCELLPNPTNCPQLGQCANGGSSTVLVNTLNELRCALKAFDSDRNSCSKKRAVQRRFLVYLETLNCFLIAVDPSINEPVINIDDYAESLTLTGCSGGGYCSY